MLPIALYVRRFASLMRIYVGLRLSANLYLVFKARKRPLCGSTSAYLKLRTSFHDLRASKFEHISAALGYAPREGLSKIFTTAESPSWSI
uniref:Uncharacterized protein n=1 Tax=Physcomitrium patens TaxID=3218 RepID=A0A2K1IER5_PHYPA|nr:hypothetical protein PHYPA_029918 [Physcomitrium patens]